MGVLRLVAISAGLTLLASCSGSDESTSGSQAAPVAAATAFYAHLEATEPAAACSMLSAATRAELASSASAPCDRALVHEALPSPGEVRGAARYGSMAQVRFAKDVVFLSRYAYGWRVVAAGCRPPAAPDGVYDCSVKGG